MGRVFETSVQSRGRTWRCTLRNTWHTEIKYTTLSMAGMPGVRQWMKRELSQGGVGSAKRTKKGSQGGGDNLPVMLVSSL